MAFEQIKEQLKDNWADLSSKIQENSAFNNLREKFEGQTPTVQRLIIAGAISLVVLFLLSFPWSYISQSQDDMAAFGENRGLIEGLLHASRAAKEPAPLPAPIPEDALKSRIQMVLRQSQLVPEQIGEMQALPANPAKDLAPAVVVQTGMAVQIKKLNVDQIVAISQQLQALGDGIKLMGIDVVQSQGQTHYYDLIARVVSFALTPASSLDTEPAAKGSKRSGKRSAPKDEEAE